ncbi:MAG: DNA repair protein RecO C-terminal domain-containing protein, partial [Pseudomonadota bacterium]
LLLDQIESQDIWPALYVRWELGLLSSLGFGLDLEACALSGANDGLTHVSPKTGRAVRGSEAEDYVSRLLRLPGFLVSSEAPVGVTDIADGLTLTGHFIETRVFNGMNRAVPAQRAQLVARLLKRG